MKKILFVSSLMGMLAAASGHAQPTFSMWGTHGAAIDYDTGTGTLTVLTGRDSNFHWNKGNWERRTGRKAFFSTDHFNGQTVENAITSIDYNHVSDAANALDAYFNIMVEDSNGYKAILAPRYYATDGNAVNQSGFVTNNDLNWYSIFEAESGWTGTASTGFGVATWDDVKGLTITTGPFTEFPDTLGGAATGQNSPLYQLSNWADWAADSGAAGAHQHGFMITFGQSTGTTQPPVVQINNITVNNQPVQVASNVNRLELVSTGSLNLSTGQTGAQTKAVANENATLDQFVIAGGSGTLIMEILPDVVVTLDNTSGNVGDGAELTGAGGIIDGDVQVGSGGILSGDLSIRGTLTLGANGKFAPGFSPGAVHSEGDLVAENDAIIEFEIGGEDGAAGTFSDPTVGGYDQLFYDGNVNLQNGADLQVALYGAYLPTLNTSFNLIYTDGTITLGDIDLLLLGILGNGNHEVLLEVLQNQTFQGGGNYDVLRLTFTAVPESGTYALGLGLAMLAMLVVRRRR